MGTKRTRNKKHREYALHVLSNEPSQFKYDFLEMLYHGAMGNTIGYMDAKRRDSGEIERLLVGLELNAEGKVDAYPLARFLNPEEVANYQAPDGRGGWE
jgi:hypothetical protein